VLSVHIFPFPITEAELARHTASPHQAFWRGLQPGFAYFEKHHLPLGPAELAVAHP
jgi:murein L,D-transpeptidase YafK